MPRNPLQLPPESRYKDKKDYNHEQVYTEGAIHTKNHKTLRDESLSKTFLNKKVGLAAFGILGLAAAVLAAYFLTGAHSWAGHHLSLLNAKTLTLGKGLLLFGVPTTLFAGRVALGLFALHKKRMQNLKGESQNEGLKRRRIRMKTLIGAGALAAVTLVVSTLVAYLAYHYATFIQSALNYKMSWAQSILMIGLPILTAGIVSNTALDRYFSYKHTYQQKLMESKNPENIFGEE